MHYTKRIGFLAGLYVKIVLTIRHKKTSRSMIELDPEFFAIKKKHMHDIDAKLKVSASYAVEDKAKE